jgi:hypothetical protein
LDGFFLNKKQWTDFEGTEMKEPGKFMQNNFCTNGLFFKKIMVEIGYSLEWPVKKRKLLKMVGIKKTGFVQHKNAFS